MYPRDDGYGNYKKPKGNLIIPETVTHKGKTYIVTGINEQTFLRCNELTSVTIPNSITYIGVRSFLHCDNLTSVTIKSEMNFDYAFLYFKKGGILYKVENKNEVWVADADEKKYSYSGNIEIPSKVTAGNTFSVTGIESSAFEACMNITSISIPNTVKYVGGNAFKSCIHLTAIYCQAYAKPFDWSDQWNPNKYKVVWGAIDKFKK